MSSLKECMQLIYSCTRNHQWDKLIHLCETTFHKKGNDDFLILYWRAFVFGKIGDKKECFRCLESFQGRKDLQFSISMAKLHFSKVFYSNDHENIESLESELLVTEDLTKDSGLILAARFCLLTEDYEKAYRLSESIASSIKEYKHATSIEQEAVCVFHWASFHLHVDAIKRQKQIQKLHLLIDDCFNVVEPDLITCFAHCYLSIGKFDEAVGILNKVISFSSWYNPARVELMGIWLRNAFQSGNWEQLLDITQAILDVEQENPYALLVLVVHAFTQDGDLVDAVDKLEDLCSILKEKYPHSIKISYTTSSLLSNICGRNTRSLNLIMDILDRLLRSELVPEHRSKVLTLQGRIRLMIPILQDSAERSLHEAMKVSSGYEPESVLGLVHSLLLADNCDDADSQLDLLMSMYSEGDLGSVPAEYHYLQALSMRLRSGNLFEMQGSEKERHISYLVACQKVLEEQNTTYSKRNPLFEPLFEPCLNIHAEMYVQLASEYFAHIDSVINIAVYLPKSCAGNSTLNCRQHQHNGASPISHSADSGFMLLHRLQQFSPGIVTSYIEIAQAKKKIGSPADGIQELEKCLAYQSRNAAVWVLKAHLEVANGSTADAVKSLEQAVSFDFAVRSSPLYLLTSAQINAQSDNFSDAIDELQKLIKSDKSLYSNESILNLKDVDYIGASLLLGYLYGHTKKLKEAKVVLEDAKKKFTGTSNVTQLLFQSALFAVEFKEYSTALQIIDQITCKHHLYAQAQKLKANTLLKNFRDQDGYLNIFQRLADERQCAQDFVALGDACMQVQRPEAAIKALEAACKLNTQPNSDLQSRIAKILVNTHQYLRAIECYEVAIADAQELPDTVKLSHDLANLLVKLGRGDAGIKTLRRISGKLEKNENAREKSLAVSTNILLANVLVKIEASANQIEETLLKAHDLQKEIVANAKGSQTESYKHLLADICVSLGDFYLSSKGEQNLHQCESCYSEALNFHASSLKALLGMTRFSLQVHDAERAISTASKLLAIDDTNEETVLLLSEAGELSKSSNNTIEPLLTFLQLNPNAYSVLARCIVYMNRAGRLNEIKHILNDNDRSPGAQYCKGLFALYENNCPLAVSLFNLLRSNSLWGSSALIKMLDIYLKPWKQFVLEAGSSTTARADTVEVHHSTTRKALLEQLRVIQQDKAQFDVIECYCIMASQIDKNGDSVRRTLSQILERDPNYTPAILALSIYHIIDGDTIKARTLLKQAVTTDNCGKHCDEYVTICLILAQGYLDQSKCAMAEEICYKCLSYDRSCAKAFELLGQAMEKEGDYSSAAQHFQKAWDLDFKLSASIGFQLAFCHLNSKNYTAAVDVCELVLARTPDYPRMKEEILKVALNHIRSG